MPEIQLAVERCDGCGLCEAFCPVSVFEMRVVSDRPIPVAVRSEDCWACDTCVGQCPRGALRVVEASEAVVEMAADGQTQRGNGHQPRAAFLERPQLAEVADWSESLMRVLHLRWNPVAISLIPAGSTLPDAPQPRESERQKPDGEHEAGGLRNHGDER